MCKVNELRKSEKCVVIKLFSGELYVSEWFADNDTVAAYATNATEKEIKIVNELKAKYDISEKAIDEWYIRRKREEDVVYISDHAMERMHERNGWNKKTALRMVKKIYDTGKQESEMKGGYKIWLKEKKAGRDPKDFFVKYGNMFYIFNGNTLITCLYGPRNLDACKCGC